MPTPAASPIAWRAPHPNPSIRGRISPFNRNRTRYLRAAACRTLALHNQESSATVLLQQLLNDSAISVTAEAALVISLGAEWCQLCSDFKPYFFQLAAAEKNILWLWYNLEEHEELLGDFYPETLLLVWAYQNSTLIRYGAPTESNNYSELGIVDFIQSIPIASEKANTAQDIRQMLLNKNWAA
jgi:hypothetical protein